MKRKGFTLVELLAVIAILAVLVVLALPNIMGMFKDAKKKSFLTEAQTIYKEATKKYITESTKGNNVNTISSSGENKLSMNGSNNLNYCVILDNKGKPTKMAISKGGYFIIKKNLKDVTSLEDSDIHEGTLNIPSCSESDFNQITGTTTNNETVTAKTVPTYNCTFTQQGELQPGDKYENEKYTYCYKGIVDPFDESNECLTLDEFMLQQEMTREGIILLYGEAFITAIESDGWSIALNDRDYTGEINTKACTSINGKPIVNAYGTFLGSQASSIDVSSFDTSNVIYMDYMFAYSMANEIKGLESFDTSNVRSMQIMFAFTSASRLNVTSFDTSKVVSMMYMFAASNTPSLDLSLFDTSNVTNMGYMFQGCLASHINLASFNTAKVTNMSSMFEGTTATTLDLSSFDTSNVADTSDMFEHCLATTGYAKTQNDADRFNGSGNKPANLNFVVKTE